MEILEQEHSEPLVEIWLREDQIDLIRRCLSHTQGQANNTLSSAYAIDNLCRLVYVDRTREILKALDRGEKKEAP